MNSCNQKKVLPKKRLCPGCGFSGGVYQFSPSIEVEKGDFRIFHFYNNMRGPLYCNQCKRKHLLSIADKKNLSQKQINFLQKKVVEKEKFYIKK